MKENKNDLISRWINDDSPVGMSDYCNLECEKIEMEIIPKGKAEDYLNERLGLKN